MIKADDRVVPKKSVRYLQGLLWEIERDSVGS